MRPCRVILANEPRLVREMLRRVLDNVVGVRVVGEYTDLARLLPAVARTEAHWIVVSLAPDGEIPTVVELVLTANPGLYVLAVAADGSQTKIITRGNEDDAPAERSLEQVVSVLTITDGPFCTPEE